LAVAGCRQQDRESFLQQALSNPEFGWLAARCFAQRKQQLAPVVDTPTVRRTIYHLLGQPDGAVGKAIALHRVDPNREMVIKGMLCARDIDGRGIATYLSIEPEVLGMYVDLFFNVPDRLQDRCYMSGIIYPGTRIGSIKATEDGWEATQLILLRAGYEHGWKLVARLAGLEPLQAEDSNLEKEFQRLEKTIIGNARMLADIGHVNRRDSPGIKHARNLLAANRKQKAQQSPQMHDPLLEMSKALPTNDLFLEFTEKDLKRQLRVQCGLDQEALKPATE
jgi:hypothetical protein